MTWSPATAAFGCTRRICGPYVNASGSSTVLLLASVNTTDTGPGFLAGGVVDVRKFSPFEDEG